MKNALLACCGILAAFFSHAQISNPGFENWTIVSDFDQPDVGENPFTSSNLETFYADGSLSATEVPGVEGSALRIETVETMQEDTIVGFAIWGNPPAGEELIFQGGFPMSDQNVTSLSVDMRHSINLDSPGFVIIQFKNEGVPVGPGNLFPGVYFFPVSGEQLTFQSETFNISPGVGTAFDECVIGFACNNVLDDTVESFPGDFMEVDNLTFNGTDQTIPGDDLNTWVPTSPVAVPDDWDVFFNPFVQLHDQSSDAAEGQFALQLRTEVFEDDFQTGVATQGFDVEGDFLPGLSLPDGFYGWTFQYKYTTEAIDTAALIAVFSELADPDPEDVTYFHLEKLLPSETYTTVEIDLTEIVQQTDLNFFSIAVTSSWQDDGVPGSNIPQDGSVLLIDDFQELILGDDPCAFDVAIDQGLELILCPEEEQTISVPDEYDAYQWYRELSFGGSPELLDGETANTLSVNAAEFAVYDVWCEVTLDGCTEASDPIFIDGYVFVPTTVASEETELCEGESTELTALGATGSVVWFQDGEEIEGETNNALVVTESGTYTATIFPNLCPNYGLSSGVGPTITVNPLPEPMIEVDGNEITLVGGPYDAITWFNYDLFVPELVDFADQTSIPLEGQGTFQAEVTDENGCTGLSNELVVTHIEEAAELTVQLYPNPTQRFLEVQSNVPGTCELRDLSGRLISAKALDATVHRFDLIDVARGVYLLQMHGRTYRVVKH
jgi:hypothetical protein